MYKIFEQLLQKNGISAYKVGKETGIATSTLTDWKKGKSTPKADKLQKIADYFGVTLEYLMGGEEKDSTYYMNEDAREMAQFMFDNPEYKVLFDASRNVKKEDIELVKQLMDRFKQE